VVRHKEFDPDVALGRAMTIFWERGYEATSVQDLVEGMGIGRRSMYDTFGDKHALFMQSLNRYAETQSRAAAAATAKARDGRDAVRDMLSVVLGPDTRFKGCLLVNSATEVAVHDAEAAHRIGQYLDDARETMLAVVERGQADGSIATRHSPETLTTVLFNAWQGLRVAVRAGTDRKRLRKDIDDILSLLD
jgi:TetR/AcrR family transcriptional regulator, transcriptional repressor for nem operon